jgi:hypothetical protein
MWRYNNVSDYSKSLINILLLIYFAQNGFLIASQISGFAFDVILLFHLRCDITRLPSTWYCSFAFDVILLFSLRCDIALSPSMWYCSFAFDVILLFRLRCDIALRNPFSQNDNIYIYIYKIYRKLILYSLNHYKNNIYCNVCLDQTQTFTVNITEVAGTQ